MNIKTIRIILLVLIIIGLGLLATQKLWVPGLVNHIVTTEDKNNPTIPVANSIDTSKWQTSSDRSDGVTFKYPVTLPTVYIHATDWPPKVAVASSAFSCTAGGKATDQAGLTVEESFNGANYCITRQSEGAAGSIYTNYAYATELQNKLVILTFTIREVQCGNYPEPQMTACNKERAGFDLTPIALGMFKSLKLP